MWVCLLVLVAMSGLCSVCGAADLSVGGDGFSYCNVCGSQSQFYQDQAFDYDDTHVYNARNVRERGIARKESQLATQELQNTLATQASQLATEDDLAFFQSSQFQSQYQSQFGDDILPFSQSVKHSQIPGNPQSDIEDLGLTESEKLAARVRKVYVEGVQMLVQMQCEALVQSFGVTPLVCGILGPVWMKFVRSTCVYEKGWAEEALLVAEAQHEKSDKEDTEDENNALAGSSASLTHFNFPEIVSNLYLVAIFDDYTILSILFMLFCVFVAVVMPPMTLYSCNSFHSYICELLVWVGVRQGWNLTRMRNL